MRGRRRSTVDPDRKSSGMAFPRRRRALLACVAVLVLGAVAAPPAQAKGDMDVMTRNLYVGASLTDLMQPACARNPVACTTTVLRTAQQARFRERAKAIADEIDEHQPDFIGLQEVALFQAGPRSNGAEASEPLDRYCDQPCADALGSGDFLEILQGELAQRGLDYRLEAEVDNAAGELPIQLGPGKPPFDVRLTDRDVILAREESDFRVVDSHSDNFPLSATAMLPNPFDPSSPLPFKRGWNRVDVEVGGKSFRLINTHLDTNPEVSQRQAEWLRSENAADRKNPVVIVGDFNAPPGTSTYNAISAGLLDAWSERHPAQPGNTCCHNPLNDPQSALERRIDMVFAEPRFKQKRDVVLVGEEPGDRTPSGLWPSDHAGVVAELKQ
jgi:endonuclease/exonuclease/phosphatase family metal-dependent hydrolase